MKNAQSATPRSRKEFRFRKTNRVLKSKEFREIYDGGSRFSCPFFVAFLLRRMLGEALRETGPRIGFTIPRAVGKAVVRNRIRRRIREMLRTRLDRIHPSFDIVVNPRRIAAQAPVEELARHIEKLVQRCQG